MRRRRPGTLTTKKPASKVAPPVANHPEPGRSAGEILAEACGPLVETLRVAVALEPFTEPFTETEDGLRVHVISAVAGQGAKERLTIPLKPSIAVIVMVAVPDCPGADKLSGVLPTAKSGVVNTPVQFVTRFKASIEPSPVAWS